jgi:tRNA U34 2-thiouridine synthase MnmA/TrmU
MQVQGTDHPALYFREFEIEKPHWLCENKEDTAVGNKILDETYDFKFQSRHFPTPLACLEKLSNNEAARYLTTIRQPFRAIVPGQVLAKKIYLISFY